VTSAQTAANTSGLLGSTNVNTASTIMARDSSSRAQVSAPSAGLDIANKTYVDTVGTTSTPVGSVALFAGSYAVPSGWFLCNGQALNRTTYSSLFGVLVPTLGTVTSITIAAPAVLTVVGHGLTSGDSIYLTTTGALPTGLTANTQLYYVTVLTVDTFNVSTTYANYIAGTKVAATVAGSGVQTAWRCAFGLGDGTTTFNVPDLRLTAQGIPNATASITAWTSYTLTIGATTTAPTKGTNTTDLAQWRRVGQAMDWSYDYVQTAAGANGSGTYLFPLPSGYSIDLTRFPANTIVGVANVSNIADELSASSDQGNVYVYDANNLIARFAAPPSATETLTAVGSTGFQLSNTIVRYRFKASVLIAQFTTNNNLLSYNIKS
jgi:microcystin-dependent protein